MRSRRTREFESAYWKWAITQCEAGTCGVAWCSRLPGPRWPRGCLVPLSTDHLFHVALGAGCGLSRWRSRDAQPIAGRRMARTAPARASEVYGWRVRRGQHRVPGRGLPVAPRPPALAHRGVLGRSPLGALGRARQKGTRGTTRDFVCVALWPPSVHSPEPGARTPSSVTRHP